MSEHSNKSSYEHSCKEAGEHKESNADPDCHICVPDATDATH